MPVEVSDPALHSSSKYTRRVPIDDDSSDEAAAIADSAFRFLRAHLSGDLRFDEHVRPLRFVLAPDGTLVASVMVAMLESIDCVLFLPRDEDDALQLQVSLEPVDPAGPKAALVDRWQAYHGDPPDVRWAALSIDAARFEAHFIDGVALTRENPLAPIEARACRELNARRDALRVLCRVRLEIDIEEPVAVGVDPGGIDVRGAFEVRRIEAPLTSLEDILRLL